MFILFETVNQPNTSIKSLLSKPDGNNNVDLFYLENTTNPQGIILKKINSSSKIKLNLLS
jgi:hypothetical protein